MDKAEVAAVLEEIALLLELHGENPFRANAYAKAGRTIAQLENNLDDVVEAGTLDQIPGIGETLRDKITTLVSTGHLPFYDDLKAKTPPGWLQMLRLPGIGPEEDQAPLRSLGIDDLAKLKAGCENGTVAKLKGFGEKTQKNILEGLAFLDQMGNRVRLDQALGIAESLVATLDEKSPASNAWNCAAACADAGRRSRTSTSSSALPIPPRSWTLSSGCRPCKKVVGHGETKSSITVEGIDHHTQRCLINADLRVVSDEQFPFALNYFTGSKEHNIRLRQRAIDYGFKLNEYDLAGCKAKIKRGARYLQGARSRLRAAGAARGHRRDRRGGRIMRCRTCSS